VTLLDAYALIALVANEEAAEEVEMLLRAGDCAISAVNLAEAIDVCGRVHGIPFDDLRHVVDPLLAGDALAPVAATEAMAWRAAALKTAHYSKGTCELSLADCFLLASATGDDAVATADPAVASIARAEGIAVVALPDRAGRRP